MYIEDYKKVYKEVETLLNSFGINCFKFGYRDKRPGSVKFVVEFPLKGNKKVVERFMELGWTCLKRVKSESSDMYGYERSKGFCFYQRMILDK